MSEVHVAAAVIRDEQRRVLIARRADKQHQGGLWEFPGGKLEAGEDARTALIRELEEELAIRVTRARPLIQVRHAYPDKRVLLDVWEVSQFSGEPRGVAGQPLEWVAPKQLVDYAFPAANQAIVSAARLPERYLITPDGLAPDALRDGIRLAVASGIQLVQLRAPKMFSVEYRDLALDVQGLCAGKAQLMLKGPLEWLGDFPAAGWHLTSEQLRKYAAAGRPFPKARWLAASCHNAEELALAAQMEVDFVTLSPVQRTQSHPETEALGWPAVSDLLCGFNRPAYLLGGLHAQDLPRAWQAGAQGVAAIRGFWPVG